LTLSASQLEFRVAGLVNKRRNIMTHLNSWKLAAIAATFITVGFVLSCVCIPSTAAQNAPTPSVVGAVQTSLAGSTTIADSLSFPDIVSIEQGATKFLEGDRITVTEVRGTAGAITPGNIYCIKGTYILASHPQAMLAAFVTAMESAEGKSGTLKVQKMMVNRGEGTFTLVLPMAIRGWPHISFYPAGGGESFGGNYFGTGEFVLKQWWGSHPAVSAPTPSAGSTQNNFSFTSPAPAKDKSDNPGIGPLPWGVR
jgi:hypothetical protein